MNLPGIPHAWTRAMSHCWEFVLQKLEELKVRLCFVQNDGFLFQVTC